ncbi:MAG: peptide ABC transporter substrate-binding protein [Candidatus Spechtbacteria bacterium SB0662_bin_43]|uniref:Peptide ABC transporter substrate-binding protein n=1 Tax=Candidatus Spechtbacteria bacterium SB0662_bin_43 TaxID=2604897 RepID=A0A845DBW7_9BACT|nr:peptide ABC transporter substrate-binding protein [Candidatus Spechtbacteria bacterium SB0662_bin_43]
MKHLSTTERHIFGVIIVLVFALILGGASYLYIQNTESVPAYGGEYHEGVVGLPRFINPVLLSTNDADRDLVRLLYSSLLKYNKDGTLVPDLAKSYTISDDKKSYTFVLKENLVWEDGTPLTTDDILFTVQTIQDQRFASPLFPIWQGVDVTAPNNTTIIFTISTSYTAFIENFTLPILPKHIWESIDHHNFALTELNLRPVGSGAFRFHSFTKNTEGVITTYTLKRNNNYHSKKPYLDSISLHFYATGQDAIRAYNARAVDGIASLSPIHKNEIQAQNATTLYTMRLPRYFALFFNTTHNKTLQDINVRQALVHATNKQTILQDTLQGYAQDATTPIPPSITSYYDATVPVLGFDPERAISLLNTAGWSEKDADGIRKKGTERLQFHVIVPQNKELLLVLDEIKKQWYTIGVELEVQPHDPEDITQNFIRTREYDILLYGETLQMIPDPYPFWHSSQQEYPGLNFTTLADDKVDTILEQARFEIDEEKRKQLYNELQQTIVKDAIALFLYDPTYLHVLNNGIHNIQPKVIVDPSWRFLDIEQWHIKTKRVFQKTHL